MSYFPDDNEETNAMLILIMAIFGMLGFIFTLFLFAEYTGAM